MQLLMDVRGRIHAIAGRHCRAASTADDIIEYSESECNK